MCFYHQHEAFKPFDFFYNVSRELTAKIVYTENYSGFTFTGVSPYE